MVCDKSIKGKDGNRKEFGVDTPVKGLIVLHIIVKQLLGILDKER